jgi:hypothetical protein
MQFGSLAVALLALLLVQQEMPSHAHVLLTYPPARHPRYDYLDNYRTGGPCGVEGTYTSMVANNLLYSIGVHMVQIVKIDTALI